ncbi:hypothetical protein [Kineococcus sp. R86509]|uniref:hypothetical protein n=1 Tax=Kineococcus sp. R86509 TaxID=3093851 RepID=UPI0036D3481B
MLRRSPLLTRAHVVEEVTGMILGLSAVAASLVLITGTPAAIDAAADAATLREQSLTIVSARTEAVADNVTRDEAPGSARESARGSAEVTAARLSYGWGGVELDRVVSASELAAARADRASATTPTTRVWIERSDGALVHAPQEPEAARLQTALLRAAEVGAVVLATLAASRLTTSVAMRIGGRRWARAWQRWDHQGGGVPPNGR